MNTPNNLTKRDQLALEVLQNGGYFRTQLETDPYTRREQFHTRLRNADGYVVKGVGFQTFHKFDRAGMLAYRECSKSSRWPSEYGLAR